MCLRVMGRRNSVTPRSRIQVFSSLENAQVQRAISCTNVETFEYVSGIFLQTLNVRTFNHYAVWCVRLHQVHICNPHRSWWNETHLSKCTIGIKQKAYTSTHFLAQSLMPFLLVQKPLSEWFRFLQSQSEVFIKMVLTLRKKWIRPWEEIKKTVSETDMIKVLYIFFLCIYYCQFEF